jgi:hypothetical protein
MLPSLVVYLELYLLPNILGSVLVDDDDSYSARDIQRPSELFTNLSPPPLPTHNALLIRTKSTLLFALI